MTIDNITIERAASKLIEEGLEVADISGHFNVRREGYRRIIISGPGESHCDNHRAGVWIYTYTHCSRVRTNPFRELNEDRYFEHSNPEFPTNLIRYVELATCSWADWWEVFEREEGEREQCESIDSCE